MSDYVKTLEARLEVMQEQLTKAQTIADGYKPTWSEVKENSVYCYGTRFYSCMFITVVKTYAQSPQEQDTYRYRIEGGQNKSLVDTYPIVYKEYPTLEEAKQAIEQLIDKIINEPL